MGDRSPMYHHDSQPLKPIHLLPSLGREMGRGQEAVEVLCVWKGNRGSGVAAAVRRRIDIFKAAGVLSRTFENDVFGPNSYTQFFGRFLTDQRTSRHV